MVALGGCEVEGAGGTGAGWRGVAWRGNLYDPLIRNQTVQPAPTVGYTPRVAPTLATNLLYFGDNLTWLREQGRFPDESVDLVYLDPPFNSNRNYNVLFKESDVSESEAQIHAFEDTWTWTDEVEKVYEDFWRYNPGRAADMLKAMVGALTRNDVTAYLTMMAPRLVELHRVLKPTGSLYLHCDPTASHYLKIMLDSIFGPKNFRNEVVWKRSSAHNDAAQGMKRYGRIHDVVLFYGKGPKATWNSQYSKYDSAYSESAYKFVEPTTGRRYATADLTANKPGGETSYSITAPGGKVVVPYVGRYWAYSRPNMDRFIAEGRIHWRRTGMPRLKLYADEMPGVVLQDVWTDIQPVLGKGKDAEDLGYDTQKPLALLGRIISASSNPGDVILDPFCGCGTAVHAAQKLGRQWIGIDITPLATNLIKRRMEEAFPGVKVRIAGWPVDMAGAVELASQADKYHFQDWAVLLCGGVPAGGERKKGADRGIDGVMPFMDGRTARRGVISVKAGKSVNPAMVRELAGTVTRDGAAFGVFVCLRQPTAQMKTEALSHGTWESEFDHQSYPKIQIVSAQDLLDGTALRVPPHARTDVFAKAGREKGREGVQGKLG